MSEPELPNENGLQQPPALETGPIVAPMSSTKLESHPDSGSVVPDADLKGEPTSHPELQRDEGSRTFTMRELLSGLKNDSEPDGSSPNR